MSQTRQTVRPTDVVQFVDENTTPNSKWIPEREILWIFSWYHGADTSEVQNALEAAVSRAEISVDSDRYTMPELVG